jgi:hypothetical protein
MTQEISTQEEIKENQNRLHQIRKEIFDIRQEAEAKISLLLKESEHFFEESPRLLEIPVGQKFLYDLYGPVCSKTEDPRDAIIEENGPNKGLRIRLNPNDKVFLVG